MNGCPNVTALSNLVTRNAEIALTASQRKKRKLLKHKVFTDRDNEELDEVVEQKDKD